MKRKPKKISILGHIVHAATSFFNLVGSLANLALIGFLVYVIYHFAHKYWYLIQRYW